MSSRLAKFGVALAACWLVLASAGCSTAHRDGILDAQERDLSMSTRWWGADASTFHVALTNAQGHGLEFPGYIIGMEKLLRADAAPSTGGVPELVQYEGKRRRVAGALNRIREDSNRLHVITHVVASRSGTLRGAREKPLDGILERCALYSLINPHQTPSGTEEPFKRCAQSGQNLAGKADPFTASWTALRLLKEDIARQLASNAYTDVLLLTMGWNTPQAAAISNINSIVGSMLTVAGNSGRNRPFQPLVIALTWPSDWTVEEGSLIPARLVRLYSFFNKREDAQEIGVTWAKALVEQAVLGARDDAARGGRKVPLTLIGHSFGARVLHTALAGPQLLPVPEALREFLVAAPFTAADRMILLQGAFDMEDDLMSSPEVVNRYATGSPRVTLTASAFDSAVTVLKDRGYSGALATWARQCSVHDGQAGLSCGAALPRSDAPAQYAYALCGEPPSLPAAAAETLRTRRAEDQAPLRYLDASRLINCPTSADAGAHSDILRQETAAFLLDEMYLRTQLDPPKARAR